MSKASTIYYDILMWLADHVPQVFIAAFEGMSGGIEGKEFLTAEQQQAVKEKYSELMA